MVLCMTFYVFLQQQQKNTFRIIFTEKQKKKHTKVVQGALSQDYVRLRCFYDFFLKNHIKVTQKNHELLGIEEKIILSRWF